MKPTFWGRVIWGAIGLALAYLLFYLLYGALKQGAY